MEERLLKLELAIGDRSERREDRVRRVVTDSVTDFRLSAPEGATYGGRSCLSGPLQEPVPKPDVTRCPSPALSVSLRSR